MNHLISNKNTTERDIIVLGNGFDLYLNVKLIHHGREYSTTFKDYARFISNKKKYEDWYKFCKSFLGIKNDTLWGELENAIQDLVDFMDKDGMHSKIEFIAKNCPQIIKQKQDSFNEFFSTNKIKYCQSKIRDIRFNKNDVIISFNYTTKKIFEKIFPKCFVDKNIFLIHGKMGDDIRVGAFSDFRQLNMFTSKEIQPLKEIGLENLKMKNLCKNGLDNIKRLDNFLNEFRDSKGNDRDCFNGLYILGLSLSSVDTPYFQYFFNLFKDHINCRYSIKEKRSNKTYEGERRKAKFNLYKLFYSNNFHPKIDSLDSILKEEFIK